LLAGCAGWLACWLRWLACLLAGCAGWLRWLAGWLRWLAGWLRWLAGCAGWLAGREKKKTFVLQNKKTCVSLDFISTFPGKVEIE
jgi:hypothetical protein